MLFLLFLQAAVPAAADFQLFKYYNKAGLIEAWGVTGSCVDALNTTVTCDEPAAVMLGNGADYNYWYKENITKLCTSNCKSSLKSWSAKVESACAGQTVEQSGVKVQAKALTLSFTYNTGLVCLQDAKTNWCFFDSQTWQGSDYIRWDPGMCFDAPEDQPAKCKDASFDIDEISPEMSAMTNLYDASLYCSECFLAIMRQRMLDPWLVQSNFTDYLIGEFDRMQKKCSTSLPYTTSSSTLLVATSTSPTTTPTTGGSAGGGPTPTLICQGQIVQPQANYLTCNDLSDKYNVSTGDARVASQDYSCQFDKPICLPLPCRLEAIWDAPSCESLARRYSNSTHNITSNQFLAWNPNIQGSCDGVALGQRVCAGAPGGTFPEPTATIVAPGATGTGVYYTSATPAHPTQSGSIADCGRYYLVAAGDDCSTVGIQFGISFAQLRTYNKYLDDKCSNLWLGYDVCVAKVTPPKVSPDGVCGPGVVCKGSNFGDCCSPFGFCGNGAGFCVDQGNGTATPDGSCGPDHGGTTCWGSFGDCCSIYGFCGSTPDFCGAGNCYSGKCATDIGGPSINGECGPSFAGNKTCTGTQFGKCCSTSGYCGSTSDYCAGKNCYSGACTK